MADAAASKAAVRKGVRVRVPLRARGLACIRAGQRGREARPGRTKTQSVMHVGHGLVIATISAIVVALAEVLTIATWATERSASILEHAPSGSSSGPAIPIGFGAASGTMQAALSR
jgi:hypothetical protein